MAKLSSISSRWKTTGKRDKPLYAKGTIELQNHGNTLWFRNIYIKELPDQPGSRAGSQLGLCPLPHKNTPQSLKDCRP